MADNGYLQTVIVLAGGLSHERDVSLRSGRRVSQALRTRGIEVVESDVDSTLLSQLAELTGSVVFPVLHGEAGEDGALREVLELLGVPFVGSVGSACRVAFDKSVATTVVARGGHSNAAQVALPHEMFRELGAGFWSMPSGDQIGFPMMVKPSRCGSALGCTKVTRASELPAAMVGAYAYGSVAVIEEFIEGTEVAVTVVDRGNGPIALPAVEIRPESGVYDYTARYTAGATRFLCPAEVESEVAKPAPTWRCGCTRALGLRDLSRTDLIVDPDGEPVFLEVNVAPGMTETSRCRWPSRPQAGAWGRCARTWSMRRRARGGRVRAIELAAR